MIPTYKYTRLVMTHNSPLALFSLADQLVNLIGGLFERQLSIKLANNCRLIKRRLFILARFLPLVCIYAAKTMSDISPASDKLVVCCVCDFGAYAAPHLFCGIARLSESQPGL